MTDVLGRTPKVGDKIAIAFEYGSHGILRVGTIEGFDKDRYGFDRVECRWHAASEGGLPQSPVTKVQLRNYVIVS